MKILLGVTGSVAAKLTSKIQQSIIDAGHELKTVVTDSSTNFRSNWYEWKPYHTDLDEWDYYNREDKVLHIDLVKWADRFVIAPCTANTLAKIANGFCDNLLTSCIRAWPKNKTKIIIAPAMNCEMWNNPITIEHIGKLNWSYDIIKPQSKKLFCGDEGIGAMANIEDIIKSLED